MTTADATLTRDPFLPRRPPGMRSGLALALLAHVLLIAGLAYSVDWHASTPEAVEAELWSSVPQQAAPRPVSPPPTPSPTPAPPPPAPTPKPQPVQPPAPPQVDPQIALEKAREAKREQQQEVLAEQERARQAKARRDQAKQDQDRKLAEQQARDEAQRRKLLAEKQQADKVKADQAKAEQQKEQVKADKAAESARLAAYQNQLKRMQSLAGATGDSNATGKAAKSSDPSAGYAGRIKARIKPNINFADTVDGNPTATVEVKVAPDGTITARRLVQSSGAKAWDDAVLRAIDRTDGLPRDIDGRVPPLMLIDFKPRDP